jgi:aminoglycoside phosphotransferase (APT) family kinase protein
MLKPEYLRVFSPNSASAVYPANIHPLEKQGLSSDMYSFQLVNDSASAKKEKEYILRVYKKGFEDKGPKEFELLSALKKQNISVPRVYCLNANNGPEEKFFMIMDREKGKTADEFLRDEISVPFIVDKLAEVLCGIHRVEPSTFRDSNILRSQYEFQQQQLTMIRFLIQKSEGFFRFCSPLQKKFIFSLKWSENLRPKGYRSAILHGEYIPGHVLVSNRQFTVVDWGEALVGDPAYDVAWMYHSLNSGFKTNKVDLGEFFVQCYEKHYGQKLNNLEYCKDMVALKLSIWLGLLPFSKPTWFKYYIRMADLTFGNVFGRLSQALYIHQLKNRLRNYHIDEQNIDQGQKYLVQYFEGIKQRKA